MNSTTNVGFQCVKCGRTIADGTLFGDYGPFCVACSARILFVMDGGETYGTQVSVNERKCHWEWREDGAFVSSCQPAWTWEAVEAGSFTFCPNCGGRIVRDTP